MFGKYSTIFHSDIGACPPFQAGNLAGTLNPKRWPVACRRASAL